jgi:hypothetical protein
MCRSRPGNMSLEEDQRIYELHGAIFACLADGYNE